MNVKQMVIALSILCVFLSSGVQAQEQPYVSYKIDGKVFTFKKATFDYRPGQYASLETGGIESVPDPQFPGQKREMEVGMTIQLSDAEGGLQGSWKATGSDIMPTYFSWYEIIEGQEKGNREIKQILASLDSGDESTKMIELTITQFGPEGSIIRGTFKGRLFDEEGRLHEITDGTFAVPRRDVND